jgi:aminopeptidase Y
LVIGQDVLSDASPMGLTPPTKDREPVHGKLVLVSNVGCDIADYPANVSGNIALISRGACPFGTKSANSGRSGAVAAIVFNDADDNVQGTLGTPSPDNVATFGIGGGVAAEYIKELKKGETLEVIAYIDAEVNEITTNNIVAQTVEGDPNNVVALGGHSDSVAPGPGINDDGSGSLSLLEVATQLTKFKVKNAVRFAWWSGEEEGLLGSDYYVEQLTPEENAKIRLFMDYDMMASPNVSPFWKPGKTWIFADGH